MARRLRNLIKGKLGLAVDFIGFIPNDNQVSMSIARRTPLAVSSPDSTFTLAVAAAADRILSHSYSYNEMDMFDTDDINILNDEFTGAQ